MVKEITTTKLQVFSQLFLLNTIMDSFLSLSPTMTGPPSPKAVNADSAQQPQESLASDSMQPQQPGQEFISDASFLKIDAESIEANVFNDTPGDYEEEEEDDGGTTQLVSNLQQMDLLSLVLDLLERVMSGAVTAKAVDNEAGSIRSRIRVAKSWLQQLEQSGIVGAAAGVPTGVSVVGLSEAVTTGRRDVYEEIEYLENMIDSKRNLLLRFKTVMGEEDSELVQLDDDIQQQDQQELNQQQQQTQPSLLVSDSQSEVLDKTQHQKIPLTEQQKQEQQENEKQEQQSTGRLDQTDFVTDVIGNLGSTVQSINVDQKQSDVSQQQQISLQQPSEHQELKQEQSLQDEPSPQDPHDVSMLDSLGLNNFGDTNFNFEF